MEDFGGVLEEDLGDFKFETDDKSLQQILEHRAISPTSLGYGKPKSHNTNKAVPSLTPAKNIPASLKKQRDKYEFFEAKNGGVFCRPRVKESFVSGESAKKNRGFGRDKLKGVLPVRLGKLNSTQAKSSRSTEKGCNIIQNAKKRPLYATKNSLSLKTANLCKSEKKIVPFHLPLPRQSISERKAVPNIDKLNNLIPKSLQIYENDATNHNKIRKELDFNDENKQPVSQQKSNESFDFAKPFDVQNIDNRLSNLFSKSKDTKSLAKMIMMRESLAGMPKESIGGLFRQSLSLAELDRLFEDDSTQSFENLETRLKTPRRKTKPNESLITPEEENDMAKNQVAEEKSKTISQGDTEEKELTTKNISKTSENESYEQPLEKNSEPLIKNSVTECKASICDEHEYSVKEDEYNVAHTEKTPNNSINDDMLVEIYEIEYSDDDNYDQNTTVNISALLQRSLSINDLPNEPLNSPKRENDCVNETQNLLPRSASDTNISDINPQSVTSDSVMDVAVELADNLDEENEFLRQAQEDLEKYRQEQACIDKKLAELILRSQSRRAEFKSVWGVSPRCINKKRTVKTVINAPEVSFSEKTSVTNDNEDNAIDDRLSSTKYMFENNSGPKCEIEDDLLEKSISNDLFELYIDANFDQQIPQINDTFNDIKSTTLNTPNIDDIIPSIKIDSFLENLTSFEDTEVKGDTLKCTNLVELENKEEKPTINTIEGKDNFEEIDMDMETLGDIQFINNEGACNIEANSDKLSIQNNEEDNLQDTLCMVHNEVNVNSPDRSEEKTNLAENDGQDKKSLKTVRFLNATPNENAQTVQERKENKQPVSEQRISRPKNTSKRRSIQVQIPVHFRSGSQGNISFNESGLCVGSKENNDHSINVGLLKTPVAHKPHAINSKIPEDSSPSLTDSQYPGLSMTTPMALRDISNKAQRELAMLYSPCLEEDEESPVKDLTETNINACKQLW